MILVLSQKQLLLLLYFGTIAQEQILDTVLYVFYFLIQHFTNMRFHEEVIWPVGEHEQKCYVSVENQKNFQKSYKFDYREYDDW